MVKDIGHTDDCMMWKAVCAYHVKLLSADHMFTREVLHRWLFDCPTECLRHNPSLMESSSFTCHESVNRVRCYALVVTPAIVSSDPTLLPPPQALSVTWYFIPSKHGHGQRRKTSFALPPSFIAQVFFHVRVGIAFLSTAVVVPRLKTWFPSLKCSGTCRPACCSQVRVGCRSFHVCETESINQASREDGPCNAEGQSLHFLVQQVATQKLLRATHACAISVCQAVQFLCLVTTLPTKQPIHTRCSSNVAHCSVESCLVEHAGCTRASRRQACVELHTRIVQGVTEKPSRDWRASFGLLGCHFVFTVWVVLLLPWNGAQLRPWLYKGWAHPEASCCALGRPSKSAVGAISYHTFEEFHFLFVSRYCRAPEIDPELVSQALIHLAGPPLGATTTSANGGRGIATSSSVTTLPNAKLAFLVRIPRGRKQCSQTTLPFSRPKWAANPRGSPKWPQGRQHFHSRSSLSRSRPWAPPRRGCRRRRSAWTKRPQIS